MSKSESSTKNVVSYAGWAPDDDIVKCPYCEGTNTDLVGYLDSELPTEVYVCDDCEVEFTIDVGFPF